VIVAISHNLAKQPQITFAPHVSNMNKKTNSFGTFFEALFITRYGDLSNRLRQIFQVLNRSRESNPTSLQ
jgi:hypothetical protein